MTLATIEEAIVYHLLDDIQIQEMVDDKVYLIALPQSITLPAITYQRISTDRLMTHDQDAGGLATARIQFDTYATTYAEAKKTASALRNSLLGYKGQMGGVNTVRVDATLSALEQDSMEPDLKIYRITTDYLISYEEGDWDDYYPDLSP